MAKQRSEDFIKEIAFYSEKDGFLWRSNRKIQKTKAISFSIKKPTRA